MVDMYVSDAYALWACGFNSHLEHHSSFFEEKLRMARHSNRRISTDPFSVVYYEG